MIIKKLAIKIKNNEGTAAASNKSSDAEIYAVVAKVSKLKGLNIRAVSYTHLTLPTKRIV